MNPSKKFGTLPFLITTFVLLLAFSVWYWVDAMLLKNETNIAPVLVEEVATSTAASDWRTYRNDKYGMEFKYPTSLGELTASTTPISVGGLGRSKTVFYVIVRNKIYESGLMVGVVPINEYRFANTGGGSITYDVKSGKCKGDLFPTLEEKNNFDFDSYKGCYIAEGDGDATYVAYLIPNIDAGYIYQVSLSAIGDSEEKNFINLNEFISNFKFTN